MNGAGGRIISVIKNEAFSPRLTCISSVSTPNCIRRNETLHDKRRMKSAMRSPARWMIIVFIWVFRTYMHVEAVESRDERWLQEVVKNEEAEHEIECDGSVPTNNELTLKASFEHTLFIPRLFPDTGNAVFKDFPSFICFCWDWFIWTHVHFPIFHNFLCKPRN